MANVYVRSGAAGAGTGADWANAYTTLAAALTAKAAGDDFWVSEDHAESTAGAVTLTPPGTAASPNRVICVDHLGTVPPVSADLRTTATVTTTGNNAISFASGFAYFYGITFSSGTTAAGVSLNVHSANTATAFDFKSCKLVLGSTGAAARIIFGNSSGGTPSKINLNNTTVKFGATGQGINLQHMIFRWRNTASAIDGAGSVPTTLFITASRPGIAMLEGIDLSAAGSGKTLIGQQAEPSDFTLKDCQFGSGVTVAATGASQGDARVRVIRSDSAGTNYRHEIPAAYEGSQVVETVIIRTGGASDGTTGISWKIVTTANSKWYFPFEGMPLGIWNDTTAANVTVTVEGLQDPRTSTSLPNNDDIWFDVEYLGASGNPLGSFAVGTKADALAAGAALTASTQAWDSLVTARANSTAYNLGDARKVASNPGRVFICTAAGTSAGSEPAGYATAVDGGAVTDNTATFTAAVRFKQAVTLSSPQPGQKGRVYLYPKMAKASATYYLDPLPALS